MDNMAPQEGVECHFPTPEELSRMIATIVHNYLQQYEPAPDPPPVSPPPPLYVVGIDE